MEFSRHWTNPFRIPFGFLAIILFAHPLAAIAQPAPEGKPLSFFQFVVNVEMRTASIFGSGGNRGNGTGWIYKITTDPKTGKRFAFIFTNKHVVGVDQWIARDVKIEVKDGQFPRPDTAPADVVYVSPYIDSAMIRVDLSKLERSADFLVESPLPPRDHQLYDFEKYSDLFAGREAVAVGNPLGGRGMMTYGEISGSRVHPAYGVLIQTQAPINGGNSGGPLLDKATGVVIGMNSLKLQDADNVGMAIPVAAVIEDYERWQKNPNAAFRKDFPARISMEPEETLKLTGADAVIRERHPDYFRYVSSAIVVEDAIEMENGFYAGDIIVTINGKYIGEHLYRISPLLTESDEAVFEVVRNNKMITLRQSYASEPWQQLRRKANFVMLSGIVFQEASPRDAFLSFRENTGGVRVAGVIPNPEMRNLGLATPPTGSVLYGVNLGGKYYKISNLDELKVLLRARGDITMIRLDVRSSIPTSQGPLISPHTGNILVEGTITTFNVPIGNVYTPKNIGLNAFAKRYQFDGLDPKSVKSRSWKENLIEFPEDECDRVLTGELTPLPPPGSNG